MTANRIVIRRKFSLSKDLGESYRFETIDIEMEGSDEETVLLEIEEAYRLYIERIKEGKIR